MRFVKWGAISVVGIVILLFFIGISNRPPSGAELSNKIEKACNDQYGEEGAQAVAECRMRQDIKVMQRIDQDRESSVDHAVGR